MIVETQKNSVIIEGLWFSGKTTLAQYYCSKNKYKFIPEPIHLGKVSEVQDIDKWYRSEHSRREMSLVGAPLVVLDRSSLSSYAFAFAMGRDITNYSAIDQLKKIVRTHTVLVVYLKSEELHFPQDFSSDEYYSGVKQLLLDTKLREKYEQWFFEELPYKHGITPFILRTLENGTKKKVEKMEEEIRAVLAHNRVAQVNIVCYWKEATTTKILVLKRNQRKGGFWQTITGGVHVGESIFEAARREIFEEIGLESESSSLFATKARYSFMGNDGYILDEYVFASRVDDRDLVRISEEHTTFEWLDVEEAKKRVAYENNRIAIDSLSNKIGNH